jgi:hypothetical protein
MLLMTAGARPHVYEDFTPEGAEEASRLFVGSDQAWLGHSLGPGEAIWTDADGVVRWGKSGQGRIMFFPGNIKPWDVADDPFVATHYRHATGRHGLVLGHRRDTWDEARKALAVHRFDGVIAFPAAAERWPAPVDAIAQNRTEVDRLAHMLGFDRLTVCGA